jgi:hypothetical protein
VYFPVAQVQVFTALIALITLLYRNFIWVVDDSTLIIEMWAFVLLNQVPQTVTWKKKIK